MPLRNCELRLGSSDKVTQSYLKPVIATAMSELTELAARIFKARKGAGIPSAAEAARRLKMEAHAYRHYENGTRVPPTTRLPDMARVFKVSLEWLITGKGDPSSAEVTSLWEHMTAANRAAALRMLRALADDDGEKQA